MASPSVEAKDFTGALPPAGGKVLVMDGERPVLVSRALGARSCYLILAAPAPDEAEVLLPLDHPLGLIYRVRGQHFGAPIVLVAPPSDAARVHIARLTAAPMLRDRRRAERIRVQVPVQLVLSSGSTFVGRTVDLSSGGARVEMEQVPRVGDCGSIELHLGPAGLLRCEAEVLRIEPDALGRTSFVAVVFRHIPVSDRRRFLRFLIGSARADHPAVGRSDQPGATPGGW